MHTLLSRGMDPNAISTYFSPLHVASLFSGEEAIHILCNFGGDVLALTKFPSSTNTSASQLIRARKEEVTQKGESVKGMIGYIKALLAISDMLGTSRKKLILSKLSISYIPRAILNCKYITYLDLSRNRLQILPAALATLRSLKNIDVRSNPLLLVPPQQRNSANGLSIVQYLSGVESQTSVGRWTVAKCVILGLKKSGKTTILRTLLGENQVCLTEDE